VTTALLIWPLNDWTGSDFIILLLAFVSYVLWRIGTEIVHIRKLLQSIHVPVGGSKAQLELIYNALRDIEGELDSIQRGNRAEKAKAEE
jgi:hypothetical protein